MKSPTDPSIPPLLALLEAQIAVDRSGDRLGYNRTRGLKRIRDFLRSRGFPRTEDEKLSLTLMPDLQYEASAAGFDWATRALPPAHLAPLFEIDAQVMTGGTSRDGLSPTAFSTYVTETRRLIEEHTAIRARMYNGES
jgi:hypothetical protein